MVRRATKVPCPCCHNSLPQWLLHSAQGRLLGKEWDRSDEQACRILAALEVLVQLGKNEERHVCER
jgi:hypothetical protein